MRAYAILSTPILVPAVTLLVPAASADCDPFFQDLAKPCGWEGEGGVHGAQVCNENAVGVERCIGAGCGLDQSTTFAVECAVGSTFDGSSFYVRCPPGNPISLTEPCTTTP